MVIRRFTVLVALLFCTFPFCRIALGSLPGGAPASAAQDSDFTMEGKITDKSAGKLTVSSGDNIIFHILYNDKTQIKKKDGSVGTAQDLHIGVTISVAGDLAESGEITARKIAIEAEGSDKQ
jgi:hypothetical protein